MLGSQQVFWLNTYIRPNIHSDVQYCLKCPPNSTVALILACSVRQELADHLGTHSAQCRKHNYYIAGVEIALIRLSGLSKKLSGQVDRPAEVIRWTSR